MRVSNHMGLQKCRRVFCLQYFVLSLENSIGFHPGGNLPNRVETFSPGWKPSHPGGNLST